MRDLFESFAEIPSEPLLAGSCVMHRTDSLVISIEALGLTQRIDSSLAEHHFKNAQTT